MAVFSFVVIHVSIQANDGINYRILLILGETFIGRVTHTFLNGQLVYSDGIVSENKVAQALTFDRI